MIRLRPLAAADVEAIATWPAYPAEFGDLDYALRQDGWLAEFRDRPQTWIFVAELCGELAAFSLLALTAPGEAEFRIALHPDLLGRGLGGSVTAATLERAFTGLGLVRVHLIVRRNNPRAIALYHRLGFAIRGESRLTVNARLVDFFLMDLPAGNYLAQACQSAASSSRRLA